MQFIASSISRIPKKQTRKSFVGKDSVVDRWIELATLKTKQERILRVANYQSPLHMNGNEVFTNQGLACVPAKLMTSKYSYMVERRLYVYSRMYMIYDVNGRAFPKTRLLIFDTSILKIVQLLVFSVPNYSFFLFLKFFKNTLFFKEKFLMKNYSHLHNVLLFRGSWEKQKVNAVENRNLSITNWFEPLASIRLHTNSERLQFGKKVVYV